MVSGVFCIFVVVTYFLIFLIMNFRLFDFVLGMACLLSSCGSVETAVFGQLKPGEVTFPREIGSVAFVNAVPGVVPECVPGAVLPVLPGDGARASRFLRDCVAGEGFLRASLAGDVDGVSPGVVDSVARVCGVDVVMVLEGLDIGVGQVMGFDVVPMLRVVSESCLSAFVPGRARPLFRRVQCDTLMVDMLGVVSQDSLRGMASEFAASRLADFVSPHWVDVERGYFDGGHAFLRDGCVLFREGDLAGAERCWVRAFELRGRGKLRFRAAFNLALVCEMRDDVDGALSWLERAEGCVEDRDMEFMLRVYRATLVCRRNDILKLDLQLRGGR